MRSHWSSCRCPPHKRQCNSAQQRTAEHSTSQHAAHAQRSAAHHGTCGVGVAWHDLATDSMLLPPALPAAHLGRPAVAERVLHVLQHQQHGGRQQQPPPQRVPGRALQLPCDDLQQQQQSSRGRRRFLLMRGIRGGVKCRRASCQQITWVMRCSEVAIGVISSTAKAAQGAGLQAGVRAAGGCKQVSELLGAAGRCASRWRLQAHIGRCGEERQAGGHFHLLWPNVETCEPPASLGNGSQRVASPATSANRNSQQADRDEHTGRRTC
jgi:hypothetical protein